MMFLAERITLPCYLTVGLLFGYVMFGLVVLWWMTKHAYNYCWNAFDTFVLIVYAWRIYNWQPVADFVQFHILAALTFSADM